MQQPFVVKDKVARAPLPAEFGLSQSKEFDIFFQCFETVIWVTGRASGL